MNIPKGGIAFFDSGIGGLTVLSECRKRLQSEIFYYYGDNERAPYGNLSADTIMRYTKEAFDRFAELKVAAAVIACNTVTAICVETLRKQYAFPIIGAEPAVIPAAKQTKGKVLILTTRGTYESDRFHKLCQVAEQRYPHADLHPVACDGLAGVIEKEIGKTSSVYTEFFPPYDPMAVVLGCTHYIYIKDEICSYYHCPCYDGNEGIAVRLQKIIECRSDRCQKPVENLFKNWEEQPHGGKNEFFLGEQTTDNPLQQKGYNTNKCSWSFNADWRPQSGQIFFLGSGKTQNKRIYKQMFAFDQ